MRAPSQRRGINTFIALCLIVAVGSGAFVWVLGSSKDPYVGMSGAFFAALFILCLSAQPARLARINHLAFIPTVRVICRDAPLTTCSHASLARRPSSGLLFGICTYLIVLGIFDEVHRMSALIALLTLLVYAGVLLRAFTAKVCLSVRRRSIRSEPQKQ
jgi:membrane associated rhomboid family serine protease